MREFIKKNNLQNKPKTMEDTQDKLEGDITKRSLNITHNFRVNKNINNIVPFIKIEIKDT